MNVNNLPAQLLPLPQWVGYMLLERPGESKPSKVPINPHTLKGASSTNPATWGALAEAQAVVGQTGSCKDGDATICGIGFVFASGGGIVGVDLDNCLHDSQLDTWAAEWVQRFSSYTEISPSGTGLHIYCLGALPGKGVHKARGEMYDNGRFFTVTGDSYDPPRPLQPAQEAIDALYAELTARPTPATEMPTGGERKPVGLSDDELLEKAMRSQYRTRRPDSTEGAAFAELWEGDISRYADDDSRADQALCNALAFWTNCDADRMDRLFRQSKLYRPKWDEVHGADTYGWITINNAISTMTGPGYDPDYKPPAAQEFGPVTGRTAKTAAEFGELDLKFIWYPYFPMGDYSVIMADGGTGKTIICCGIAAAVTTGKPLPGEDFWGTPRDVLIISGEDRGELLKKRLAASGADLNRAHILDCIDSVGMNFTEKYDEFRATILRYRPALIIIDPWHGFVGPEINVNQVNALRPALQRLAVLAKECCCTLLLISHVNKRAQGENANNAATGSTDFINASRAAVRIIFDEEDEDCRLMVHTKANYSKYGQSVRYRITDGGGVQWEGFSDITRATLEQAARSRSTPGTVKQAAKAKDCTRENLIYALKQSVDGGKPVRFTYAEFEEKWGALIFGGGQAKRALDGVKPQLAGEGVFLKTGIQVRRAGKNSNGFMVWLHETPTGEGTPS